MSANRPSHDRIRDLTERRAASELPPDDEAVLQSIVAELTYADLSAILEEFFDDELVALVVYEQFIEQGKTWNSRLRDKQAESLTSRGLDEEAEAVRIILT